MVEHLVHNERVKLRASVVNGLAIAYFVAAFVQTLFLDAINAATSAEAVFIPVWSLAFVFGFIGLCLHLLARHFLGELKEKSSLEGSV